MNDQQITELREHITETCDRVTEEVSTEIISQNAMIQTIESELNEVKSDLKKVFISCDTLKQSVQEIKNELITIKTRINEVGSNVTSEIENAKSNVNNNVDRKSNEVNQKISNVDSLIINQTDLIVDKVDSINPNIALIENSILTNINNILTLQDSFESTISSSIHALTERAVELKDQLSSVVNDSNDSLLSKLNSIEQTSIENITSLNLNIENLSSEVQTSLNVFTTLSNNLVATYTDWYQRASEVALKEFELDVTIGEFDSKLKAMQDLVLLSESIAANLESMGTLTQALVSCSNSITTELPRVQDIVKIVNDLDQYTKAMKVESITRIMNNVSNVISNGDRLIQSQKRNPLIGV